MQNFVDIGLFGIIFFFKYNICIFVYIYNCISNSEAGNKSVDIKFTAHETFME